MRRWFWVAAVAAMSWGCGAARIAISETPQPVRAHMDLVGIDSDRVRVEVDPGAFPEGPVRFFIPQTVPGTYSTDNYGRYIEGLTALDGNGQPLEVQQQGPNEWLISDGKALDKVTYWVNDSFDTEQGGTDAPFSPAGTNILTGTHFMLNLHGFVGYFSGLTEHPYELVIQAPQSLYPATSLPGARTPEGHLRYTAGRYFDLIDNPIQLTPEAPESFQVGDITVVLSVYSPNRQYKAADFKPSMERMMQAQKAFLGDIDGTRMYNILLYLSAMGQEDAMGFGALEHHTSTVVVLPEQMPKAQLEEAMTDVVSHEFFHIVTPLNIHSEEIQFFDYNNPKMSRHLWMYEGTTEYFANLFQIRQGLIEEADFYNRLMGKVQSSMAYNDSLSFTEMSARVLEPAYEPQYANVYEKGTLINMTLDILLREQSAGEMGVLDLMRRLSGKYGTHTPFRDEALIDEIAAMTYPEVRTFFDRHVIGSTPIDYDAVFAKVGLLKGAQEASSGYFLKDLESQMPFIDVNPETEEIYVRRGIPLNTFFTDLGAQGGDVIQQLNGTEVTLETIRGIIGQSFGWTPETDIRMEVLRNGEVLVLEGKAGSPTVTDVRLAPDPNASLEAVALREAWLRN